MATHGDAAAAVAAVAAVAAARGRAGYTRTQWEREVGWGPLPEEFAFGEEQGKKDGGAESA